MCIIFFGYNLENNLPLVLASNRDEFWNRPTAPLHYWGVREEEDAASTNNILAGKDLERGGTWLGIDIHNHRLAVVTNFREPPPDSSSSSNDRPPPPSRGKLATDFVSTTDLSEFMRHLEKDGELYPGFNLLFGSREEGFYFFSNRSTEGNKVVALQPNRIYGISNGQLDEPWPKMERGKQIFRREIDDYKATATGKNTADDLEGFWKLLTDEWKPPEHELPSTGVPLDFEKALSSIFVQAPQLDYGTRCSTLVLEMPDDGIWQVHERTYRRENSAGETLNPHKNFEIKSFQV